MLSIRQFAAAGALLCSSSIPALAAAQAAATSATEPNPRIKLDSATKRGSPTTPTSVGRTPDAGTFSLGGGLGGGRLADSGTGLAGVGLDLHVGYFPTRWLGLVGNGNVLAHSVDEHRTLRFYGAALKAEVHPIDRFWIAAGPGYYALTLSVDGATSPSARARSLNGVGGEAELGFELYRARPNGGLATGLVARAQVARLQDQAVFTTVGLLNLRWYSRSGPAQTSSTPASSGANSNGLEVSSSCGDPLSTVLSVLQLGGKPCAYGLGGVDVGSQLTSFAARLLRGKSYGVFLGRLAGVGNLLKGISVQLDTAESALQLLHHDGDNVKASGSIKVVAGAAQRWRIARTPRRALIWLNDQLVVNEAAPIGGVEAGLVTDGSELELSETQRKPLTPQAAGRFEALEPITWPAPAAAAQPSTALDEPAVSEPAPERIAAPEEQGLLVLRGYYSALSNGRLDAARYFAPQVARYIGLRNTTPAKIQSYLDHGFPRQFRQARFEMDESTYRADGPDQYSFTERASYFNVAQGQHENIVSLVRVRFDEHGKLTHLWQDEVIEHSAP